MNYNKHKQRSHKSRRLRLRVAIHFLNEQPSIVDTRFFDYGFGYW